MFCFCKKVFLKSRKNQRKTPKPETVSKMFSPVCNFQFIKNSVELNGLFLKILLLHHLVCYMTYTRRWTTCKRGIYVKSYCFLEKSQTVLWILQILQNAPVSCFRGIKAGNFFCKKARRLLLDRALNMPLHMIRVFTLKGISE